MNAVDRIKEICAERKIAISRLEKDLGFSNGYIAQIKDGAIRADRLLSIASYLGVEPACGAHLPLLDRADRSVREEDHDAGAGDVLKALESRRTGVA